MYGISFLVEYSLFYYIVDLNPKFLHRWAQPNPNILLRYSLCYYIAKLCPIWTKCWGIAYLVTFLSNSQILIHCWPIPNLNTLLRYTKHYRFVELYPILVHCQTKADIRILVSVFPKRCRQPIRTEHLVTRWHNKKQNPTRLQADNLVPICTLMSTKLKPLP